MSGNVWDNTIVISKTKLNQMTIISGTSAYLSGLSNVTNQVHLPTDTGSGYIAYNLFTWNGSADVNLSNPVHSHSGINSGGDETQIAAGHQRLIDTQALFMIRCKKADWIDQIVDSLCTLADDSTTQPDSIKLTVGSSINTRVVEYWDGMEAIFDNPMYYTTVVKFNTLLTNMVWITGVDVEDVGDAGSGALKVGFEHCSSVNGNYHVVSADGTTRTASDTGVALDTTNERQLRAFVTPTVKTDWKVHTTVGVKTTNVPDTGNSPDRGGIMKHGIKTTVSSGGKSVNHWGSRLIYSAAGAMQQ